MAAAITSTKAAAVSRLLLQNTTRRSSSLLNNDTFAIQQSQQSHHRFYTPSPTLQKKAWEPSLDEYKYRNREESKHGEASYVLDMSPESIQREARIIALAKSDTDRCSNPLIGSSAKLPFGSKLLHVGIQPTDFPDSIVDDKPNVLFISPTCPHAGRQLPLVLQKFPSIEWIHVRSAGIDFLESDELPVLHKKGIVMTNAKGQFSSSLAEYVMMACSYFAKDIPRLLSQKKAKVWNDFDIEELVLIIC